jgi:hypothetical protein
MVMPKLGEIFVKEGPGLLNAVACAPRSATTEDVIAAANHQCPSGTSGGWQISDIKKLADGAKLPVQCLEDKDRVHWLLDC